jgi:hypothetical protein
MVGKGLYRGQGSGVREKKKAGRTAYLYLVCAGREILCNHQCHLQLG